MTRIPERAFLYLLRSGRKNLELKVGHTTNLRYRIKILQDEKKVSLRLVALKIFTDLDEAKAAERSFHQWANRLHDREGKLNEWYPYSKKVVMKFMEQSEVIRCG